MTQINLDTEAIIQKANREIDQTSQGSSGTLSINASIFAIVAMIETLTNVLQATFSKTTNLLATSAKEITDEENIQLDIDAKAINDVTPDQAKDDPTLLTKRQNAYSSDQTKYNSWVSQMQGLTQNYEQAVSDISNGSTTSFQNAQAMIEIFKTLAGLLR